MITGVLILTVEILIGLAVLGQEPQGQQTQSRPEPEEVERALELGRGKTPPIEPSQGGITGRGDDLLGTLTGARRNLLWPEDFRLAMRSGQLNRTQAGFEFVFAPDQSGHTDKPIKVLPNSKLRQMRIYAESSGEAVEFAITGPVTEYHGANYVLVRDVTILGRRADPIPATTQPTSEKQKRATATDSGALGILDQMEQGATVVRPLRAIENSAVAKAPPESDAERRSVAPAGEFARLWPEDMRLANRVGRLVREPESWTFAFESDSDKPADPPIRLLPNLALQRLEELSADGTRSLVFTVSGDVTEYGAHNYLLVRRFSVRRDDGNIK